MVLVSHERQWFVDQNMPLEMPQLSGGVAKLFLQSLFVDDEWNVFPSVCLCSYLKNKKVRIAALAVFVLKENAVGIMLV